MPSAFGAEQTMFWLDFLRGAVFAVVAANVVVVLRKRRRAWVAGLVLAVGWGVFASFRLFVYASADPFEVAAEASTFLVWAVYQFLDFSEILSARRRRRRNRAFYRALFGKRGEEWYEQQREKWDAIQKAYGKPENAHGPK